MDTNKFKDFLNTLRSLFSNKKTVFKVVIYVLILASIPIGAYLVQQQSSIKSKASTGSLASAFEFKDKDGKLITCDTTTSPTTCLTQSADISVKMKDTSLLQTGFTGDLSNKFQEKEVLNLDSASKIDSYFTTDHRTRTTSSNLPSSIKFQNGAITFSQKGGIIVKNPLAVDKFYKIEVTLTDANQQDLMSFMTLMDNLWTSSNSPNALSMGIDTTKSASTYWYLHTQLPVYDTWDENSKKAWSKFIKRKTGDIKLEYYVTPLGIYTVVDGANFVSFPNVAVGSYLYKNPQNMDYVVLGKWDNSNNPVTFKNLKIVELDDSVNSVDEVNAYFIKKTVESDAFSKLALASTLESGNGKAGFQQALFLAFIYRVYDYYYHTNHISEIQKLADIYIKGFTDDVNANISRYGKESTLTVNHSFINANQAGPYVIYALSGYLRNDQLSQIQQQFAKVIDTSEVYIKTDGSFPATTNYIGDTFAEELGWLLAFYTGYYVNFPSDNPRSEKILDYITFLGFHHLSDGKSIRQVYGDIVRFKYLDDSYKDFVSQYIWPDGKIDNHQLHPSYNYAQSEIGQQAIVKAILEKKGLSISTLSNNLDKAYQENIKKNLDIQTFHLLHPNPIFNTENTESNIIGDYYAYNADGSILDFSGHTSPSLLEDWGQAWVNYSIEEYYGDYPFSTAFARNVYFGFYSGSGKLFCGHVKGDECSVGTTNFYNYLFGDALYSLLFSKRLGFDPQEKAVTSIDFNGKILDLTGKTATSITLTANQGSTIVDVPVTVNYNSGSPTHTAIRFKPPSQTGSSSILWGYNSHPNFWPAGSNQYTAKQYIAAIDAPTPTQNGKPYDIEYVWSGPYKGDPSYRSVIYQPKPNSVDGEYAEWEKWSGDSTAHRATNYSYGGKDESLSRVIYKDINACNANTPGFDWPEVSVDAPFKSTSISSKNDQGSCSSGGYVVVKLLESWDQPSSSLRNRKCDEKVSVVDSSSANSICKTAPNVGIVSQRYALTDKDSNNIRRGCEMTVYAWGYPQLADNNYQNWFRNGELRWSNYLTLEVSPNSRPPEDSWWDTNCERVWKEVPNMIYTGKYKLGDVAYIDTGLLPNPTSSPVPPSGSNRSGYTYVWGDEFNGTSLDNTKWTAVTNCRDKRNNEQQCHIADDVSVAGGNLVIKSERRSFGGYNYTSGAVKTETKFTKAYGRFEMRAELPSGGQGLWPAFWLFSPTIWPPEIDILENINDMSRIGMTYHWGTITDHKADGSSYTDNNLVTGFHTYAIEWEPGEIRWYIDDILRKTHTGSDVTDIPMQIYLNTALGGNFPGPVADSTVFPQNFTIDYVRVYDKSPTPTPTSTHCNRCSTLNAYQRTDFYSQDSACATVIPSANPVTRTCDCSCPASGLNATWNSSCISSCNVPTPTPTITPTSAPSLPPSKGPTGLIDYVTCDQIAGWTCDADDFTAPLEVKIYKDSFIEANYLGVATAGSSPNDKIPDCNNTGNHRYFISTPNSVKDGTNHKIYVVSQGINQSRQQDGSNAELNDWNPGHTQTINCPSTSTSTPAPTAQSCSQTGDINGDGVANLFDYPVWYDSYINKTSAGDCNKDGVTDLLDYVIWWKKINHL